MPRSGTKLLRGLLGQNARIGIPNFETEFLPFWVSRWESYGDLSQRAAFHAFYERAVEIPYFTYLGREGALIREEDWYASCADFSVGGVFEALIRHDADAPRGGDRIWGDKSPSYITHLPLIKRLYPEARFVHIVRDVRDYCLSVQSAWKKNPLRAAQRWVDGLRRARADAAPFTADVLDLRFEDLISDPQAQLRRVCDFIGVEFDDAMLTLDRTFELRGDAKGLRTIKRDNTEKWRTRMAPRLRERIERIAGEELARQGYPVDYSGPTQRVGAAEMKIYQAVDFANLIRTDVHRWGPLGAVRFRWRSFAVSGNRKNNKRYSSD